MDTTDSLAKPSQILPISFLVTGTLASVALALLLPQTLPYLPLLILLTLGAAQDLHTQTVDDIITLGGIALGLALSFLPQFHGIKAALSGAIICGGAGVLITLLGKSLFGKSMLSFEPPEPIEINPLEKTITFNGETNPWENLFSQGSGTANLTVLGESGETPLTLEITTGGIHIVARPNVPLDNHFRGKILELSLPRDTMGWGDSKILALIGCFLGIQGGLFTLFSGALLGAIIGKLLQGSTGRIPFAPFLWAGAYIFVWRGLDILHLMGWNIK